MKRTLCIIAFALLAGGCNPETPHQASDTAPENPSPTPWSKGAMVTAANPYAADAGIAILEAGETRSMQRSRPIWCLAWLSLRVQGLAAARSCFTLTMPPKR